MLENAMKRSDPRADNRGCTAAARANSGRGLPVLVPRRAI